jgi:hypothetical protein
MGEAIQEADSGGNMGGAGTLQDMAKAYEEIGPERVWVDAALTRVTQTWLGEAIKFIDVSLI